MGAAPSVPFNDEQKAEVAKKLLLIYNDPQHAGKSTEELQALLMKEYESIVVAYPVQSESTPAPAAKLNPSPSSKGSQSSKRTARDGLLQKSFDRDNGGGQSTKSARKGPTRRRSFDKPGDTAPKPEVVEVIEKLAAVEVQSQSQSAPHMDISGTAVDSWDSVSTQPYCDLCKMAFKNKAFLERHMKYSNLHIQNEKAANAALGVEHAGAAGDEKHPDSHHHIDDHPPHTPPPHPEHDEHKQPEQEEGRDYRLLYSGSKFYWRTQHTVDFDMYHHFATKTIEIIPHNNTHQKELNRIYLNYPTACQLIAPSVDAEVEAKVKAIINERFAKQPDREAIREDILLQKLVTYLLSRLHFEADDGHGKAKITALSQDAFPADFLHEEHPAGLIPIKVTRRRRSTAEEIDETINIVHHSLNSASQLSSEATSHSHRVSTWDENDPQHNHTPTHLGAIALNSVDENAGGD